MGESAEKFRRELSGLYEAANLPLDRLIANAAKLDPLTKLNTSSLSDWKNGKSVPSVRDARYRRDFALLIKVLNAHARDGYVMYELDWWEKLRAAAYQERNSTRGARAMREPGRTGESGGALAATAALGRPIGEWNPLDLEVKPAAVGPGRDPDRMLPRYVRRAFDKELAEVVERAAAGASEMVVLVGNSSTGKTRACWEAVQPLASLGWRLWHPHHSLSAPAALAALDAVTPRTVLWLNEAQQYLDAGQDWALKLNALLTDPGRAPVLVVGTLWNHHDERYSANVEAGGLDVHLRTRELLSGRRIPVPNEFDRSALSEAERLAASGDGLLAGVLRRRHDGRITQFLGGCPELTRSYAKATPVAKGLLHAAMDARRLGVGL
ncbi:MAG TPA: hypothetical protein VFN75_11160, partial [Pseudonocardiaceae bacterium]|nr:hypothetical protein [Pseudonocardiaceae bacterium]